jgi:hypothetical protein
MSRRNFPAGVYAAQAVRSWVTRKTDSETARFRFEIIDCKHNGKTFDISVAVTHPNKLLEVRGRRQLERLASAVEVNGFDDTEALHRKPLTMTLYKFKPRYGHTASVWTCEPIDGTGVKAKGALQYAK